MPGLDEAQSRSYVGDGCGKEELSGRQAKISWSYPDV